MRLRLASRRAWEVATITAAVVALAWAVAQSAHAAGPPHTLWPVAGVLGWPLALAL